MNRIWRWMSAFGRFWYHFVVGDDWTAAAAVVATLLGEWGLHSAGVPAWWLLPLVVILSIAYSIRRLERRQH